MARIFFRDSVSHTNLFILVVIHSKWNRYFVQVMAQLPIGIRAAEWAICLFGFTAVSRHQTEGENENEIDGKKVIKAPRNTTALVFVLDCGIS